MVAGFAFAVDITAADAGEPQPEPCAQVQTNSADPSSVPTGNGENPLPRFQDCANCPEAAVLPAGSYWMAETEEDKNIGLPHVGDPGVMFIQRWSGRQLGRMDHDLWCGWPVAQG